MQFTASLFTLASIASFVSAAPGIAARQTTSVIYACTDSTFPEGDPCPYGISMGSGFCAALNVEPGVCYNWSSFPDQDVSPLVNNLTFVEIPNGGGVYGCSIYTSDDCSGDFGTIQDGQNDLSCPGLGPLAYNDKVNSFICSP